jgi:hypothetical protein
MSLCYTCSLLGDAVHCCACIGIGPREALYDYCTSPTFFECYRCALFKGMKMIPLLLFYIS